MERIDQTPNKTTRRALLVLNIILLAAGILGGPMVMRLYFIHGGNRLWLSTWLQSSGFPIIFIPLLITYLHCRRKESSLSTKIFSMRKPVFLAAVFIGVLTGLGNYFYAYGVARLPVSTLALVFASRLPFAAVFAFLLVKQKFTPYSINGIALLSVGAGVLALHASSDRPKGESNKEYYMGLMMTVAASALSGFMLPLVELTYRKARQAVTYSLVLEFQLVMSFVATLGCTIGMVVNNDFEAIPKEAREFELGETTYYVVLVCFGITSQCFFLGAIGVVFSASSLFSAIIPAVLLPVREILAVIFFSEKFQPEKGISLVLSLWGFASYFYGEMKHAEESSETQILEN